MKNIGRKIVLLASVAIIVVTLVVSTPGPVAVEQSTEPLITEFGSLDIALSPETPDPQLLTAGAKNITVAAFELTSYGERVQIDTLTVRNCVKGNDGNCTGDTNAGALVENVRLRYPNRNGEIQTTSATLEDDVLTFSGLDLLLLPDEPEMITLSHDVREDITQSGAQIQWSLNGVDGPIHARGLTSGQELTQEDIGVEIFAAPMTVYRSQPIIEPLETNDLLAFSVFADGSDLTWSGVTFKIDTHDESNTDWNTCKGLRSAFSLLSSGVAVKGAWQMHTLSGGTCDSDEQAFYISLSNVEERILEGELREYTLTMKQPDAPGDFITASLPFQEELSALRFKLNAITWSDGHATDIDGSFVRTIPLFGKAVQF